MIKQHPEYISISKTILTFHPKFLMRLPVKYLASSYVLIEIHHFHSMSVNLKCSIFQENIKRICVNLQMLSPDENFLFSIKRTQNSPFFSNSCVLSTQIKHGYLTFSCFHFYPNLYPPDIPGFHHYSVFIRLLTPNTIHVFTSFLCQ